MVESWWRAPDLRPRKEVLEVLIDDDAARKVQAKEEGKESRAVTKQDVT